MILTQQDLEKLSRVLAAAQAGEPWAVAWVTEHWDTITAGVAGAVLDLAQRDAEPPHDDPPARRRTIPPIATESQ